MLDPHKLEAIILDDFHKAQVTSAQRMALEYYQRLQRPEYAYILPEPTWQQKQKDFEHRIWRNMKQRKAREVAKDLEKLFIDE